MANNISGGGFLSGLGSFISGTVSAFVLLAEKILGYTSVTSVPVQKNSLIMYGGYTPILVSKKEAPFSWEDKPKQLGILKTNGTSYLGINYSSGPAPSMYFSEDLDTFEQISFPLANPTTGQNDILGPYYYDQQNEYNVYAGIPHGSGLFITGGLVNNTFMAFKSAKGTNLETFNTPANASYMRYHGTIGDNSYFIFSIFGVTHTYRTSKIALGESTTYTPVNLSVDTGDLKYRIMSEVFYANGIYAVTAEHVSGNDNHENYKILTSTDGINFTEAMSSNYYLLLNLINNRFVVYEDNGNDTVAIFQTTPDFISSNGNGETHNLYFPESSPSYSFRVDLAKVLNGKIYIPFTSSSIFAVSTDGLTWTLEDCGTNIQFDYLLEVGTTTVNVPLAGGSTYYTTTTGSIEDGVTFVTNYEGSYAAALSNISSTLGSRLTNAVTIPGGSSLFLRAFVWNNKYYLSTNIGTYISDDGNTWSQALEAPIITSEAKLETCLLVSGSSQYIYSTTDNSSWSTSTISGVNFISQVFGAKNVAFAITGNVSNNQQCYISTDSGQNWTLFDKKVSSVDYGDNKYVMVSADNSNTSDDGVYESTDNGATWTKITSLLSNTTQVIFGNGAWIFWGGDTIRSTTDFQAIYTTFYSSTEQITSVIFTNNKLIGINRFTGFIFISEEYPYWGGSQYPQAFPNVEIRNNGIFPSKISTLVETQISIGDQGSGTAEIIAPVTLYRTAMFGQGSGEYPEYADIAKITLKNLSNYPVSVDIARFGINYGGFTMNSQTVQVNDEIIQPGQTFTYEPGLGLGVLYADMSFVVLPSSVDAIEAKIYKNA